VGYQNKQNAVQRNVQGSPAVLPGSSTTSSQIPSASLQASMLGKCDENI